MDGLLTRRRSCIKSNGSEDSKTVDVAIDVDIYWLVLDRITCNRTLKRGPRGIFRTRISSSEGVWFIWLRIYTV